LDVRPESDYNLFHIPDAHLVHLDEVAPLSVPLLTEPDNTVIVVMSNGEEQATEAWKTLVAEGVLNVYILEGGLNCWLDIFARGEYHSCNLETVSGSEDLLYDFNGALGPRHPAANPDPEAIELEYTPKVKIKVKKTATGGGCG